MSDPTAAQDAEDARIAAMRRASSGQLPPARIGVDPNSPGGEDPNHTSTNVEPTSIGGLNPFNSTAPYNPAPQVSNPGATGPATTGQQNVSSQYGGTPGGTSAIQRAAALASATAGGPPPGFTGTFNGTSYSNGQPTSAPVSPIAAATSGSLGPTSVPTGSGSGSLTSALTPTGKYQGGNLFPNATAPAMQNPSAVSAPGARTTDIGAEPTATPGAGTANITGRADGGPDLPGSGSGDLGALTTGIMSQLQGIQNSLANPGTPIDAQAVYLKQASSILDMLNQQEAQLKAENAKQGTEMDPATQFTIDKLRQNLEENLKTTRENLNSRGLYESGIELQLENNLQKGSASDQAQVLADRLSKLQDQLNTGLSSIRQQKFSTASQFGLAGANAQNSWDENSRKLAADREQNALSGMLSLRGQVNTANDSALSRAAAQAQSQAALAQNQSQFNASAAERAREFGNLSAYQQAQLSQSQESAMQRAAAAARTGGTGATAKTTTQTTTQQRASTVAAAQAAIENDYETSGDAIAAVQARARQIIDQVGTAGYQKILDHAAQLPSGKGIGGSNNY